MVILNPVMLGNAMQSILIFVLLSRKTLTSLSHCDSYLQGRKSITL
jgi:hypothetical protein